LSRALGQAGFFATLVDVSVDGAVHRTLAREVQYHPITDAALHIDFMRVGAGAQVTVSVPVHFVNHERAPGLRRGGILNVIRHDIDMVCSVDAIPDRLTVDLSGLDIGASIHISAVTMPPGAHPVVTARDFTIASVAASSAVREEAMAAASAPPTTGGGPSPAAAQTPPHRLRRPRCAPGAGSA